MSALNETFHILLNWDIYKSEKSFEQYIIKNRLPQDQQKILIDVYEELEKFKKSDGMLIADSSLLNKALQIKNNYVAIKPLIVEDSIKVEEEVVQELDIEEEIKQNTKSEESIALEFLKSSEDNKEIKSTQNISNSNFERLEFRGNSMEYFKIWIVNIFLTIVTLGIYSAWAKVRTNRYFYANTYFQNSSFEYTADPKNILRGRLIVFSIYALFVLSSQVLLSPIMTLVIFVFALGVTPWIINRAIKFKLKTVKHRNINFRYQEDAKEFYKFFALHSIINIVTLGLAYPYSLTKFKELFINNSNFGNSIFAYSGTIKEMYMQFLKVIGGYIIVLVPFSVFSYLTVTMFIQPQLSIESMGKDPELMSMIFIGITITSYALSIFFAFIVKGLYDAFISNYVWSKTEVEDVRFECSYSPVKLAWIYLSNIFAIIFSAGLLTPWAKVRVTNYKCQNFAIAAQNMSSFITAAEQDNQSAIGEETEDFFDMDIGI